MGTDPEFIPLRRRSGATLLNFDLLKWANFSTISAFSYLSSSKRMPYGNLPELFFIASFTRFVSIPYVDMSSMHVLCMASIYYCDGVAMYRVGEVPLELCSSLLTLDNAQIRFGIVLAQSQPYRY